MSFQKLSLNDLSLAGQRVLARMDFNVPLKDGKISNPGRIVAALPTMRHVLEHGGSLVLMSHLGRPKGKRVAEMSLAPVAQELSRQLGREVAFAEDCVGEAALQKAKALQAGQVLLLENLRFHPEEKAKDPKDPKVQAFCRSLSSLGDIYINDAFGTAHRAHASMVGVDLPQRAAGFLMQKELEYFGRVMSAPKRPYLAILGGAKVADKILLIEKLLEQVDEMIIGGAMAYTFKKVAFGVDIGASLFDEDGAKIVDKILQRAQDKQVQIHLPIDHVTGDRFAADATRGLYGDKPGIPAGHLGLDCGPESLKQFCEAIARAQTIMWNGPIGVFEFEAFAEGSQKIAQAVAQATAKGATTIVGGGDTATAAAKFGVSDKVSHVSTGGGAALELLEGKELPGVAALSDAPR